MGWLDLLVGSLRAWALLSALGILPCHVMALDNGLARTPAMGYNTWNSFGGNINEKLIRQTADLMLTTGLADAGYKYLVVDDAWSNPKRTADGRLQADPNRFPSGMKALGDYIHKAGLLFGMYSDAGAKTCMGLPGSRGFEPVDASTFADWGIDYLKYDNCYAPPSDWVIDRYQDMGKALNATGRPILYSMCDWGSGDPWIWGRQVGNSWRTTGDISPTWEGILSCLDNTVGLAQYAGPGGWNDPDLLEVGNGELTLQQQRSHFALWALLKAPLMVSADLRKIKPESLEILLAEEVIAVNQDPLGVAGDLVWKQGPYEVYACPLKGGGRAVVLFNRHFFATQYPLTNMTVRWSDIGYKPDTRLMVRDLFLEEDFGTFTDEVQVAVDLHDVRMLKLTPMTHRPEFENWRPWTAAVPRFALPVTIQVDPLPDQVGADKSKASSDPESLPDYAWGFIEQTLPTRYNSNGRFGRRSPTYLQQVGATADKSGAKPALDFSWGHPQLAD